MLHPPSLAAEARQALLQAPAPAQEIRFVMGEKIRDRAPMRLWRRGVEHDRHDLQEMVLFDDDAGHGGHGFGRHGVFRVRALASPIVAMVPLSK